MHEERAKQLIAMGDCLVELQYATDELKRNPGNATAVRDYNFGVSRIFQIIHDTKLNPWTQPLTVPTARGEFVLTYKPDPRPEWNPALYEFTPADEFDVGGKYVTERSTRDGVVPYWSSHMDGAKTEDIVPSDHGAQQNPQAIEDVLRILKKYAN